MIEEVYETPLIISREDARKQGLKRFYTGVLCPSGHDAERFVCNGVCLICNRIKNRTQREQNPERDKQYRENSKKSFKVWSENNKDIIKKIQKKYKSKNKHKSCEYSSLRRAIRLNATPKWARTKEFRDQISKIYEECKRISEETGIPHNVDHIVPLNGKFVTGLHVPANLRIIPATENFKKHNKFIEELVYDYDQSETE